MNQPKHAISKQAIKTALSKEIAEHPLVKKNKKPNKPKLALAPLGVTGIVNPFDPNAEGLKLPDATSYPSLPFHIKTVYSFLTSSATGATAAAYYPFGSVFQEQPTSVTAAGVMNWNNATDVYSGATNWSNYQSAMGLYRTVVGGVKIIVSSSLLNTQGRLYVCHVPIDGAASATGSTYFPGNIGSLINMPLSEEYPLAELCEEELIIPFRRYSDVSEHYRDSTFPIGGTATVGSPEESACGWCAIVVLLVGASLTNQVSFDVEHILICEGIELGNDTILATSPAASYDPKAMATIYQINQAMPTATVTKDPEQGSWVDVALRKTKNTIQAAAKVAGFVSSLALMF
jgi:hypothetical protein